VPLAAPPGSREDVWRRPAGRPEREIQGGAGPGAAAGGGRPKVGGSLWGVGAFRTAGPAGRGPLRGFPPAPGAPDPVYPPGQFSPWNLPAGRPAGSAGRPDTGPWPDAAAEPGYRELAVSDPSADMTITQTWAVLDAAQLDDGWVAFPAGAKPPAGPAAGLAPGGVRAGEQNAADPWADPADTDWSDSAPGPSWPDTSAATAGPDTSAGTAWPDSPADTDWPDSPAETSWPSGIGTARNGQWPGSDTDATGQFPAAAEIPRRYEEDAEATAIVAAPAVRSAAPARGGAAAAPGRAGTRVSRATARGRKPRKPPSRARVWLLPILMALAVGILVTVAYLHFVKGTTSGARVAAPLRKAVASSSPTPSLGPWKHITTRSEDPSPLTLAELFPAQFSSSGTTGTRTIDLAGTNCSAAVLGAGLQSAVSKAGCTQVLRASYITTDHQIMGTIGVLNLVDATSAQRAGQATGAAEFIDQLPAASGPTHNLTKGTGLEEAVYKGHYLILIWAEFTNLKSPTTAAQRAQLKTFSDNLVSGTANISLTSRMVVGKPQIP
jgi:hypothetical protein